MQKVIEKIKLYLENNTSLFSQYNGGGAEDNFLTFEFKKVSDYDINNHSKDKIIESVCDDMEKEISPIFESLFVRAQKYSSLIKKIEEHQYIQDENGEVIENPNTELTTNYRLTPYFSSSFLITGNIFDNG